MSPPLAVRSYHIQTKKGLLGKITRNASFECPHCKTKLVAGKDEIGKVDACPSCGGEFILPKEAAEKIRRLNEADEAAARRQTLAEQKQNEELAARKRQEQEAAAARRSEREEDKADARRQQNAAQQLSGAKDSFRNYDIRKYPALETLAIIFLGLMWCVIIITCIFVAFMCVNIIFDYNNMRRSWQMLVPAVVVTLLPSAVIAFLLRLVVELIRLSINMAQDTERIVRQSEAQMGKPWAPK